MTDQRSTPMTHSQSLADSSHESPPEPTPAFGQTPQPDPDPDTGEDKAEAVALPLFSSMATRFITKEVKDMERLAKRDNGDAETVGNHVVTFYRRHVGQVAADAGEAASIVAGAFGLSVDSEAIARFAENYADEQSWSIRSAFKDDAIPRELERWTTERAAQCAAALYERAFIRSVSDD